MTQDEIDVLLIKKDWPNVVKRLSELGTRVEALEQRGSLPAAPTSASEIPDVKQETPAPVETTAETPAPEPAPVETPVSETPAQ